MAWHPFPCAAGISFLKLSKQASNIYFVCVLKVLRQARYQHELWQTTDYIASCKHNATETQEKRRQQEGNSLHNYM
jgi:hypothetical protein